MANRPRNRHVYRTKGLEGPCSCFICELRKIKAQQHAQARYTSIADAGRPLASRSATGGVGRQGRGRDSRICRKGEWGLGQLLRLRLGGGCPPKVPRIARLGV